MMRPILKGSTDQSVVIRIVDSTDGTPETGVVFNTSGIDLWYRREGATRTSITEATLSALNDAHSDGGILHIGDGYYRLDLPDAAFATGANGVMVGGTVTGMVVIGCYVPLFDVNPYDAVRMGMTALPNAAAEAAGGLYTRGSGAGQINQNANGQIDARGVALSANVITATAIQDDAITAAKIADNAIDAGAIAANAITDAKIATGAITAAKFAAGAIDAAAIADNAIDAGAIAADAITSAKIADNALTAAKIADGAIDAATFAAGAIDAAAIAANAIGASELAADAASEIATAVRTELATELGRIDAATSTRLASASITLAAGAVTVGTNNDKTGYRLSATGVDDVLDEVVLGSYTLRQLMRGLAAANLGKLSGAATTTITIRSADDTKDVVVSSVDANGNRSAVTLDLA